MNYDHVFDQAIDRLHAEGRYRVFIDILRNKGAYPNARCFHGHNGPKPITVWCSNDYLAMGQHPKVISAMEDALHDVGAGSGGTRNIGGNTHYHIQFEGQVDLLFDLRQMVGFTLDVAWEEIKFSRQHAGDFRRIAVLTEDQWLTWSAWVSQLFVSAEVRVFDDEDEARAWLAADEAAETAQ